MRNVYFTFSETHDGSHEGLTAPGTKHTGNDGKNVQTITHESLSDDQKWLWYDVWLPAIDLLKYFAGSDPVHVKDSGDPVHGTKHLDNTYSAIDDEQANIALQARYPLHQEIPNIVSWEMAYGTAAHDYGQSSGTRALADKLAPWGVNPRHYALDDVNVNGFITHMAHHGPGVGRSLTNRGNPAKSFVTERMIKRLINGYPVANMFIYGHVHRFVSEPISLQWGDRIYNSHVIINAPMCGPNMYADQAAKSPEDWQAGPCMWETIDGRIGEFVPMVKTRSRIYRSGVIAHVRKGAGNYSKGDGEFG